MIKTIWKKLMPVRETPPDWVIYIISLFWTALAGIMGAVVRQIGGPSKGWAQRTAEWIGGALCAVYMTPVASPIVYRFLDKMDMIDKASGLNIETINGLAGFLSGAVGVTIIEVIVNVIRIRFGGKKVQ